MIKSVYILAGVVGVTLSACASTSVQEMDKPKSERTKIAANMQEVRLTSSPEGASCVVIKDDETLGSLDATPGFVTIRRSNFKNVDVTCSKDGYDTTTAELRTIDMDKSLDGNIGAAISLFKMAQGSISSYEDSLFVKLSPSYFASESDRATYLDDETSLLNADFTTASAKYVDCKKKKCKKRLAELQESYDTKLAALNEKIAAIALKP